MACSEVLADERTDTAFGVLRRAVAWFATHGIVVERIPTDNGSAYRSHLHRATCTELGIRHSRTRAHRPRTNGKVLCISIVAAARRGGEAHPHPGGLTQAKGVPAALAWLSLRRVGSGVWAGRRW